MNKKLIAIISAVAMCFGIEAQAQNNAQFKKGDLAFNVDYGIGAFTSFDGHSFDENILQHSFSVSGEYGIMDGMINGKGSIGVGGQLGFGLGAKKEEILGTEYKTSATRIRIATRGVFHYQFTPQFDTYGGVTFCFVDIDKYKYKIDGEELSSDSETNFIEPRLFAGARYMFSDKFGVNLETTWDRFAFVAVGVTFKM